MKRTIGFSGCCLTVFLAWLGGENASGQGKIVAGDAAPGDRFGHYVSLDENVAVVGADMSDINGHPDAGAAYVYRLGSEGWAQEAKLTEPVPVTNNLFGKVSVSDNVIAVGTYRDGHGNYSGLVYLFRHDGTSWDHEDTLETVATADGFGDPPCLDGNLLVVAATLDDAGGPADTDKGAAHVFRYDETSTSWAEEAMLVATDAQPGDRFATWVSIKNDIIVAGAEGDESWRGSAYVFRYDSTSTNWVQEEKLVASDATYGDGDRFGNCVSTDGEVVVVGAPWDDENGEDSGAVYVYRRHGSSWVEESKLTAPDATAGDRLGFAVSVKQDVVFAGAWGRDDHGEDSGSVYVYTYDGTSWTVDILKILPSDCGHTNDLFGYAVSYDGANLLVGAPYDDHDGGVDAGSASLLEGSRLVPASWSHFGCSPGWPGTIGIPDFTASGNPVLGTTITLDIENSFGQTTTGFLFMGLKEVCIDTALDGTLLVSPLAHLVLSPIPKGGLQLPAPIPCDWAFAGLAVLLQVLELDPGASQGVSFTPGLRLSLGF
ncbi:MAG: hypothetical protein AB1486_14130 [Planctomycetota bacterium]